MTINHLGEFLVRHKALPLQARAPIVEETPRPGLALVAPQLPEGFFQQISRVQPLVCHQQELEKSADTFASRYGCQQSAHSGAICEAAVSGCADFCDRSFGTYVGVCGSEPPRGHGVILAFRGQAPQREVEAGRPVGIGRDLRQTRRGETPQAADRGKGVAAVFGDGFESPLLRNSAFVPFTMRSTLLRGISLSILLNMLHDAFTLGFLGLGLGGFSDSPIPYTL